MAAKLITLEEFKDYAGLGPKSRSDKDGLIGACIDAAGDDLRSALSFDLDLQVYDERYDGNGSPYLPIHMFPVATSPLPVVEENGVPLVVAFGYNVNADVIIDPGPITRLTSWMYRQNGPNVVFGGSSGLQPRWSEGFQNVHIVYTAGYSPVPEQFKMVVRYLAKRYFDEADQKKIGFARRASGPNSAEFMADLPEVMQSVIRINRRTYLAR